MRELLMIAVVAIGVGVVDAKPDKSDAKKNIGAEDKALKKEDAKVGDKDKTGVANKGTKLTIEDVERKEAEAVAKADEMHQLLQKFTGNDWAAEDKTIKSFKRMLAARKQHGLAAIEFSPEFFNAVDEYRDTLRKAPAQFRAEAGRYAKLAESEKFDDLKKGFQDMSKSAMATAGELERRLATIDNAAAKASVQIEYAKRAVKLLDEMNRYADLIPAPSRAAEIERFIASMDRFTASMRQTLDAFREFHDRKMGAPQGPSAPPAGDSFPPPGTYPPGVFPGTDPVPPIPAKK